MPGDIDGADAGSSSRSSPPRSSTGARPTRRPTSSAGSASARCRTCASSSSRTCRRCRSASTRAAAPGVLISRAVQRRRGARHARLRRHRDAVRLVADADRHRGDPVRARRPARAAHLPRVPGARRSARSRFRIVVRRRLPGARARRSPRSPPTCRRRCRASASCARSRRSRATWTRFAELNEENRDANMKTVYLNAAYFPGVELLSALATAGILLYGGIQADRRRHHDRRARRLPRRAEQLLRPDPAALAALHDLPVGHGRAGQDLRAARRGAGPRRRAGRASTCRGCAARSCSTT